MISVKKLKDICIISSTDIDIIHTIKWHVAECLCHKQITTPFPIVFRHSDKWAIDIDTKVLHIRGSLMGWNF